MDLENLGIVIVDMQNKFRSCMDDFNGIVESHQNMINFGKQNKLPIFYLEYQIKGSHMDPKINTISEIKDELIGYQNSKRIRKYSDNGFFAIKNNIGEFLPYDDELYSLKGETFFDFELKNKGIEKIIFTGVNRSCCVKQTAEEAKNKGYKIYTSDDLMNNYKKEDWFTKNSNHYKNHKELIESFSGNFVTRFFDKIDLSPKNSY